MPKIPPKKDMLLGLVLTLAIGLASAAFTWTFNTNTKIELMNERLTKVTTDRMRDDNQDRQIQKFWKFIAWMVDQINQVRFKSGLPPSGAPDLN